MKICYFQANVDFEKETARLLVLTEKFWIAIDTGNKFGALLSDLPKKFNCFYHSLLIAKLHWYGLSPLSLEPTYSYFRNRTHCIEIKKYFSNRLKIECGVPQVQF